jgi:hypothetical protein
MKKLLLITPHLSTGGCPQVVLKKIELLKDEYIIKCIEWQCLAWIYVVQRNKIIDLLGNNFHSLGDDKESELFDIIEDFQPDFISMEEFPEFFMPDETTKRLYNNDRRYSIFETTHNSTFNPKDKRFFPDKFLFVCAFNALKYTIYDIPFEVIEYPIDSREKPQLESQSQLGLESDWKHVVNVGLFTPGKNQGYAFDMAKKLSKYKIKFHFVGNQAVNFEHYWGPLMKNKPDNCVVWGERSDVPTFLQASDLFLFTSIYELNPISIKEALEYDMPLMLHNLDVYCGKYNENKNITYLTGDLNTDVKNVLSLLNPEINESLNYDKLNIKLVHILLDPEHREDIPEESWKSTVEKQRKSRECWENIKHKFTSYVPRYNIVNRTELPADNCAEPEIIDYSKELKNEPPVLSYGHYGCFTSNKNAIIDEFTEDVDLFVLIGGDVVTDLSPDDFYDKIIEAYELGIKHNAGLINLDEPSFLSGGDWVSMTEDFGDWVKVPHFMVGDVILIFKSERENIKHKLNNTGWHSFDIWMAWNYHDRVTQFTSKKSLVYQLDGYSVLDYNEKKW